MSITHTKTVLSDELKFLIACCQTEPSVDDMAFIHSYLSLITNYQSLITTATQHGILPLIHKTIKNLDSRYHELQSDSLSSSRNTQHVAHSTLLLELKTQYMIISQRNMLMSAELIKIMKLLKENQIEALAFKGPALSQMAYGDITLRQYVDLDVLVKKEDIYKIDTLLKDRDYQRFLEMTPTQEKVYLKNAHDLGLYHPKSGVHFEMHWSLMNEDYPMQIDLATIWQHPQSVKINGKEIPTFSNDNLLLYLCIHGSKHLWERIEWIKDIDLLIRKKELDGEDIDWEKVIKEAKSTGFETMFYLGLSLTVQLFETPLPGNSIKRISDMKVLGPLSDFVLQNWQTPKSSFQKTAAMLKLFPGIRKKITYLNRILIKPSLNEYWAVDLPKGFYWVYYLVRPYMLIKKYLTK